MQLPSGKLHSSLHSYFRRNVGNCTHCLLQPALPPRSPPFSPRPQAIRHLRQNIWISFHWLLWNTTIHLVAYTNYFLNVWMAESKICNTLQKSSCQEGHAPSGRLRWKSIGGCFQLWWLETIIPCLVSHHSDLCHMRSHCLLLVCVCQSPSVLFI